MRVLAVIFAVLAVAAALEDGEQYEASIVGMQGLKVFANTEDKFDFVRKYEELPGYDFAKVPRNRDVPIDVFVAADCLDEFKSDLVANGIEYRVFVEDMSKIIEHERVLQTRARKYRPATAGIPLDYFLRYSEISTYLTALAEDNSDFVELFSIGKSYEGRNILGVKITNGDGKDKPALFIDAGIHAREWIAPSTALYAINQLILNPAYKKVYDNIDIYVIPVLNPDGYEYTHTTNRMWRKTRSNNPSTRCIGVDANRNFELEWMSTGASSNPCSEIYAGSKPFSEPETAALRDFILARKDHIKVYLSFHSYGNYILHPWGYTSDLPENEPLLRCVAVKAESRLAKIRGTHYSIGSSTNVLYAAAGGSDDWVLETVGADLSYTVELPGGNYGFAPPPREIIPVGRETFEAIQVFAAYVAGEECHNF